jgi:hypothetical protein
MGGDEEEKGMLTPQDQREIESCVLNQATDFGSTCSSMNGSRKKALKHTSKGSKS